VDVRDVCERDELNLDDSSEDLGLTEGDIKWNQRCSGASSWWIRPHRIIIMVTLVALLIVFLQPEEDPFFYTTFYRWHIQGGRNTLASDNVDNIPGLNVNDFIIWKKDTGIFLLFNLGVIISYETGHAFGIEISGYHKPAYEPKFFKVKEKLGWFLMYAPAAFISFACLLYCMIDQRLSQNIFEPTGSGVLTSYICFLHMIKRVWEEQFAVHSQSSLGAESYGIIAQGYVFLAWTTCKSTYEINREMNHPYVVIGVLIWTIGCLGNGYCHMKLAQVNVTFPFSDLYCEAPQNTFSEWSASRFNHRKVLKNVYIFVKVTNPQKTFKIEKAMN